PERVSGVQGGLIQTSALGSSIVLDGVILSNTNGNHVRTNQNTVKVKVTNSIFANMGALTTSNLGAGKGLDLRDVAHDSLIMVNNTFVNYQDRAVRHYTTDPTKGAIKYGLIDHNTFINGMGYHGLLSLGNVGSEIIVANNLFMDAFALGEDSTDASRAAEWANTGEFYPNGNNRISWIFSTPNDTTQWTIGKNYYAVSDSGLAFLNDFNFGIASPLSHHLCSQLGADSVNAFIQLEDFDLVKIPRLMTNMMRWYEDTTGGNKSKNTPSDKFVVARDDFDRRVLEFYRDSLDASYSTSSPAYSASTGGFPVGDLNWFPTKKAEWEVWQVGVTPEKVAKASRFTLMQNYPNPFNPTTKIAFNLEKSGMTKLTVFNMLGQTVAVPISKIMRAGQHEITFDASGLTNGMYFYKLECSGQVAIKKMLVLK
ncbi:MAG: T9SS type A sorting domain-containing protein, partial [Candidatus Marinimicrobia bacterium]|nr:T9SS type A sorting domain-containing protein [Candidatus Neomarinimicrobiota bacterium]